MYEIHRRCLLNIGIYDQVRHKKFYSLQKDTIVNITR